MNTLRVARASHHVLAPVETWDGWRNGSPRRLTDYELMAESMPHIVWVANAGGVGEYLNRRGIDFTGMSAAPDGEVWSWARVVHLGDAADVQRGWRQAIRTQTPFRMDFRIRRRDGAYLWHAFRADCIRDESGQAMKWIGVATDIEAQRVAQAALEASQRESAELATLLDTLQSSAPIGFGFVDRDMRMVRINAVLAAVNGAPIEAQIGRLVSEIIPDIWPMVEPLYRKVLDTGEAVLNIEADGFTASDPSRVHHWLASYYPVSLSGDIIGVGVVVLDVTEQKASEVAHDRLTRAVIAAMANTMDVKDPYTAGHQSRVADIAAAIARHIGMGESDIDGIHLAASIHDIGKLGIPAEILSLPRPLRPAEMELIRCHSQIGHDIMSGIEFPWPVAEMILRHHERWDGSGYPGGLRGSDTIIGARVIAVADSVEAMASHRPYRPSKGIDAALANIRQGRDILFDPDVVDACLELFGSGALTLA